MNTHTSNRPSTESTAAPIALNPKLAVYTITENQGRDAFWQRIGTAFENKDGSINVLLNALPCDRKLHIRLPRQKTDVPF